jgi:hypothetical protein
MIVLRLLLLHFVLVRAMSVLRSKSTALRLGAGAFSSSGAIDASAAYSCRQRVNWRCNAKHRTAGCQHSAVARAALRGRRWIAASRVYAVVNASSPLRTPTPGRDSSRAPKSLRLRRNCTSSLSIQLLPDYALPGLCADPLAPCFRRSGRHQRLPIGPRSCSRLQCRGRAVHRHLRADSGASVEIARGADAAAVGARRRRRLADRRRVWRGTGPPPPCSVSFANAVNVSLLSRVALELAARRRGRRRRARAARRRRAGAQ